MSDKLNAKRVTITLAEETLAYVDDTAKKIGTSRSAMLAFMIEAYRKQDEAETVFLVANDYVRE